MEALRNSLLVPAGSTLLITYGCAHAMKEMIRIRYKVKDESGKSLLPHPYAPWTAVPKEYQSQADDAYRAFKMFENVKEWTFLSLPVMWTSFLFLGGLPYMTEERVEGVILITSLAYMYGTSKFISGYIQSPETRVQGFKIRMYAVQSWLGISAVSILYAVMKRFGFV